MKNPLVPLCAVLRSGDQADELERVGAGVAELVHLVGRYPDHVAGPERALALLALGHALPVEN